MTEPSELVYVEIAKIKLALGDLYMDVADDLPGWLSWLAKRLYRKATVHFVEGYEALRDWEQIKRSVK